MRSAKAHDGGEAMMLSVIFLGLSVIYSVAAIEGGAIAEEHGAMSREGIRAMVLATIMAVLTIFFAFLSGWFARG